MATSAVHAVRAPALTSTSDPPPVFDGATRLYIISYICPFAQCPWITRNYKVPSFEHNGKVLGESLDLIKYIDANFEGLSLVPSDSAKKEFGEQLISHLDTFTKDLYSSLKGDPIPQAGPAFDYLENALGKFDDGPFFLGQFSWVDIAYIPFVERFQIVFSEVFKHDITEGRPKLAVWIEKMNKIDAYTQTRADPKEIVDLYKKIFLA